MSIWLFHLSQKCNWSICFFIFPQSLPLSIKNSMLFHRGDLKLYYMSISKIRNIKCPAFASKQWMCIMTHMRYLRRKTRWLKVFGTWWPRKFLTLRLFQSVSRWLSPSSCAVAIDKYQTMTIKILFYSLLSLPLSEILQSP